jgi:hypothetical protein
MPWNGIRRKDTSNSFHKLGPFWFRHLGIGNKSLHVVSERKSGNGEDTSGKKREKGRKIK